MGHSDEMAFINPKPPPFVMETRQMLEGLNLNPAQLKDIALQKLIYLQKLSLLESEFFGEVKRVLENMESKV